MIKEFQDEYRWLSNFAPCKIVLDEIEYPSVEHAYMSAKSNDPDWKEFCSKTESPGQVKRASRSIDIIPKWDEIKLKVMKECINQKYNQEPYLTKLRNTGNKYIQEGNRWNDKFWGVDLKNEPNEGFNNLGKLIMTKRDQINRIVLIKELMNHATKINANKNKLVMILSITTDSELIELHKDFLTKK